MAHNLTETSTFASNVPVPDPGDNRTAASVIQFAQPLADRTKRLKASVRGANSTSGNPVPLSLFRDGTFDANVNWAIDARGAILYHLLVQRKHPNGVNCIADLSEILPFNVTVTGVQLIVNGNYAIGAAHAGLPSGMPFVTFREIDSGGASAYNVTQVDTSGSVGAYEADHQINLVVNRVINPLFHYTIKLNGEDNSGGGTNAKDDYFAVKGISIDWTAPA